MRRSRRFARGALVTVALSLWVGGCGGGLGVFASKPDTAEVLALAARYRFVNPRPPVPSIVPLPGGTGVPSADAPTDFTIERAVPITSPAPEGKVILARVHSNKAYAHMGVADGYNYVWRDQRLPRPFKHWWKTYMVPEKGADPKRLKRGKEEYSHGDSTEPRLVVMSDRGTGLTAFGACLDDPNCGSGHCGYGEVDAA
jgi:hypothetical protein